MVHSAQEQVKLNLEDKTINLPPEYQTGPMSLADMWSHLLEQFSPWISAQEKEFQLFLKNLQMGERTAVIAAVGTLVLSIWLGYLLFSQESSSPKESDEKPKEEEPIVLRDFTLEQLREYNGSNGKPIYIAIKGEVFDASKGTQYYGVDAPYHCFAGRDATRAMAKFSFDEAELSNPDISDIGPFEKGMLEDFIHKFKYYRCYPVIGLISKPPARRSFTRAELAAFKGEPATVEEGRVDAPIYVGAAGKVFDVSYGGKEFYGPGGAYHHFAGVDASRALAKMSFQPEDIQSHDLSDLTEVQQKTLQEWVEKFENVRKYPIVGTIVD
jgi:membrane-associated progesterone receptor component